MAHGRRRERHAGDRALTAAAAIRANKAQAHLAERRSLVCLRNAASCCGGSDASNSAHETFSDTANLDLDRITVRHTGVSVGAGFVQPPRVFIQKIAAVTRARSSLNAGLPVPPQIP